ncbi:hypothetical protein DPMN_140124 [Dreissena polymorpha]|uniref:Retinoblastoma-associated protein B-box domain-containing protein n=1 Tax=Dreissena polymorpha TaxID=45954 RepID=A0A9D4G9W5_DREPO|nr:hypothetical protein DPMN_140124 [Dreissena polymorpha]
MAYPCAHLLQIMMCSVYGICKVSDCEIRFKDIVKEYSTMPNALSDVSSPLAMPGL